MLVRQPFSQVSTLSRVLGWVEDNVIMATGKISDKDGNFKLICDQAKIINKEELEKFERILATQKVNGKRSPEKIILLLSGSTSQEELKKLSDYFSSLKSGKSKVFLDSGTSKLETPFSIEKPVGFEESIARINPKIRLRES